MGISGFYPFVFILGLAVGSFLNVLADRLPQGKSILGRSRCDHCGRVLRWFDLLPLTSFFAYRRRCRTCKGRLSWQYPIVEAATGLLFLLTFFKISNFSLYGGFLVERQFLIFNTQFLSLIPLIYLLFIVSCLVVIFVSDLKYFIIPDKIIFPAIGVTLFYRFFEVLKFGHLDLIGNLKFEIGNLWPILGPLLSGVAAGAFFLALVLITRGRGMGLGDVKLAFLMGLILGWPGIFAALFLAFMSGALVGIFLILRGQATMKSEIPFGTFLAAAAIFVLLFCQNFNFWQLLWQ
jgi:prepilin signal peptidase PulO-like enzyme (type II secretory pathway)